jgi:hypothetical protein
MTPIKYQLAAARYDELLRHAEKRRRVNQGRRASSTTVIVSRAMLLLARLQNVSMRNATTGKGARSSTRVHP